MELVLVHFGDSGARRDFRVTAGECRVGRKPESDLQIPAPTVSREHCVIRRDAGRVFVRDLGSSNGTFRNADRVARDEVELHAGDQLTVGFVQLVVQIDGKPATIAPPAKRAGAKAAASNAPTSPATTLTRRAPAKTSMHDSGVIADMMSVDNDDSGVLDAEITFAEDDKT